jgi:hypothetical protein
MNFEFPKYLPLELPFKSLIQGGEIEHLEPASVRRLRIAGHATVKFYAYPT